MSWCHLEVELLDRAEKEQRYLESATGPHFEGEEEPPHCLDHYLVTFSAIEPKTSLLKFLSEPHILRLDLDREFQGLRNGIHTAVPLQSNPDISKVAEKRICYADCLTSHSRVQLQGSEIDRSFLCFSLAEIALYLLDWLLCRLLSEPDGRDRAVGECLERIIEAPWDDDGLEKTVEELLDTEVWLDLDRWLFEPATTVALGKTMRTYLGILGRGSTFRDLLETVDLAGRSPMVLTAIDFLIDKFPEKSTDVSEKPKVDYRDLPMFSDLGWQVDHLLLNGDWSDQGNSLETSESHYSMALAGILRSIARAHPSLSKEGARLRGQDLLDRSVFPIAQILTHWPRGKRVRNYFIFPVWESLVGANYRSAIFAHVFSARPESIHDDEPDAVATEADFLNEQLLPFGRLIAQSSYDEQLRQSQIDGQLASAAYSVGHPLKRRVDSVHATLNSLLDLGPSQKMQSLIHEAGAAAFRVGRLGHVLDVLADALRPGEQRAIFRMKEEWSQEDPLLLGTLLQRLDGSTLAPGLPKIRISATDSQYDHIRIGCWLTDEDGRAYRPADLFYEELFYELLLNAAKHGSGAPDDVCVDIELNQPRSNDEGLTALTLRNGIRNSRGHGPSEWSVWNHDGNAPVGGLFFLSSLLDRVGLGRLWTRFHRSRGVDCFSVALELTGLERIG